MPDSSFEQSFYSIASPMEQDAAPALQPYRIGFQILDRNDDGTRGAGVFGYKVADSWFFAPVFFLGGRIKGEELLYAYDSQLICPKNDSWIQYLGSARPYQLGEEGREDDSPAGEPDWSALNKSPITGLDSRYGKQASAAWPEPHVITPELRAEFRKKACEFATLPDFQLLKSAAYGEADALQKFAAAAQSVLSNIDVRSWGKKYPMLHTALADGLSTNRKFASAAIKFYDVADLVPAVRTENVRRIKRAADEQITATVLNIVEEPGAAGWEKLSDSQKSDVVNGKVGVVDNRKETSDVLSDQDFVLQNPDHSGWWKLLNDKGELKTAYVSMSPAKLFGVKVNKGALVLMDGKINVVPVKYLWAAGLTSEGDVKTTTLANAQKHPYCYVAMVGNELSPVFTIADRVVGKTDIVQVWPVEIARSYRDGDWDDISLDYDRWQYVTNCKGSQLGCPVTGSSGENRKEGIPDSDGQFDLHLDQRTHSIYISPRRGGAAIGGELYASDELKLIQVDPEGTLQFGGQHAVMDVILKRASVLEVSPDAGGRFSITTEDARHHSISKRAAFRHLLFQENMSEKDANRVLKAAQDGLAQFYVKKASWPENSHYDGTYGRVVSEPIEQEIELKLPTADFSNDSQIARVVEAAQSGKKEIFDAQLLKSMVKAVDVGSIIDQLVPDMMGGMDKTGRMLFLFYWHNEDFAERLGKNELPELEDSLRQSFKTLGEVVLYLKRQETLKAREMSGLSGLLN